MKLSGEERAALRASFRQMRPLEKVEYLYTYFRLPIFLALLALVLLCSTVYRNLTKKEVVLYSAHINVSVGDTLESRLDPGFVSSLGKKPKRAEVYLYRGLYLSDSPTQEDHQYSYASRMKIMSAIASQYLDVVLMNQEAYDIFSHSGYLLELPGFLADDPSLSHLAEPYLTTNTVILEDNAIEYQLGEAARYRATTEEAVNAIEVSHLPLFSEAGFPDRVYLGVVANTPRSSTALRYIAYLLDPVGEGQG